jgi:hypothetical protein
MGACHFGKGHGRCQFLGGLWYLMCLRNLIAEK